MRYYRTPEDCAELAREYRDRFTNRSDILDFIAEKYNLVELGYFGGTSARHGIWIRQQGMQGQSESSEFRAAPAVLDFIVNEQVFTDMFIHHNTIALFGRMQGGQLIDMVALNYGALIDPGSI